MAGREAQVERDGKAKEKGHVKVFNDDAARAVGSFAHWAMGLPTVTLVSSGAVLFLLVLATYWANWTIVKRAGHPGPMSLMLYVPCVSVFFLLWFAFTRWPVQGARGAR